MAMTAPKMAKLVLLLLVLVQAMSVLLAAAARPLEVDDAGTGGSWLESGIGMLTQLLLGAKSGSNPRTHCC